MERIQGIHAGEELLEIFKLDRKPWPYQHAQNPQEKRP